MQYKTQQERIDAQTLKIEVGTGLLGLTLCML